jgi:hypothetical protein
MFLLREATAGSLAVLAVSYIVFWGCAWGTTRSTYAPPSLALPPPSSGGQALDVTVGGSMQLSAPQGGFALYSAYPLDEHHEVFGGVSSSGGLIAASSTPFGGLRLHFDVVEHLRIGLELSAYVEGGWGFAALTSGEGAFLQPGVGVGMPLAWQMASWDVEDMAPVTLTLFTDPAIFGGPALGDVPTLSARPPDRIGYVRLPVGIALQLDRWNVFTEVGATGTFGMSEKSYLVPIPMPWMTIGAGYTF